MNCKLLLSMLLSTFVSSLKSMNSSTESSFSEVDYVRPRVLTQRRGYRVIYVKPRILFKIKIGVEDRGSWVALLGSGDECSVGFATDEYFAEKTVKRYSLEPKYEITSSNWRVGLSAGRKLAIRTMLDQEFDRRVEMSKVNTKF